MLLRNREVYFFLQGLNLQPFVCDGLLDIKAVEFVPCFGILITRNANCF